MPDFGQNTTNPLFPAPSAAASVSVTPNASAWANSAWVQVIASAADDLILTGLVVHPDDLAVTEIFEIDVGVGAAMSESVVTTFRGTYEKTFYVCPGILPAPIPLDAIALSDRVSVRLRKSNTTTNVWTVALQYFEQPIVGTLLTTAQPQQCYPPAADDIRLTVSTTPWGNSTWTELVTSTSAAIVLVGVVFTPGGFNTGWEFDVGIGAEDSEEVLTTIRAYRTGIQFVDGPCYVPFYRPLDAIPASSRLSGRTRIGAPNIGIDGALCALVYIEKPL